ncbi:uncharacterized protein LOC144178587 isoform X1 [Haemaphysalis longicornis]
MDTGACDVMEIGWTALIITGACLCSTAALASSATAKYYTSATPWKQWTIGRRPCEGVQGETGLCMFNWECIRQEGTMLSACMDGFLLGACCKLPDEAGITTASWTEPSAAATQELPKVSTVVTVDTSAYPTDTHPEASRLPPSTTTTTEAPTIPPATAKPTTQFSRPTKLWPVLRLPTTLKRPVIPGPTRPPHPATLANHHKPPSFAAPAVTTWMATRPGIVFTPTTLALRPSPFAPSTALYGQRPSLHTALASTPIGMLGSLIARPFIRPITMAMKMRPTVASTTPVKKTMTSQPGTTTTAQQSHQPSSQHTTPPTTTTMKNESSAAQTSPQLTTAQKYERPTSLWLQSTPTQTHRPPTAPWSTPAQKYDSSWYSNPPFHASSQTVSSNTGSYTTYGTEGYTSLAVSRLPPSTLNDLSDLDIEVKTPKYENTVSHVSSTESETSHTVSQPAFVDLTETSTSKPPSTANLVEYTLDFDVEDRPTVTEHVYAVTTGNPAVGEVSDVTVSHVGSTLISSSTEPFSTPRPSTTTKKLKTRSPTTTTQAKPWPSTKISKPGPAKTRPPPAPTTISNDINHLTYPSKATLWPSTVSKLPLRAKTTMRPFPSTALPSASTRPVTSGQSHLTTETTQTTYKLPIRTKRPTVGRPIPVKTTIPMTAATKPKSTPKPMKPVLSMPARPAKPTKMPLPSKTPTKKSTPKPLSKIPPAPSTSPFGSSTTSLKPTRQPVANDTVAPTETSNLHWDYRTHCGVRPLRPQGRIVGGRNSFFGEWPWQVLVKEATWLGLFIKNKCGGVLISDKYALTAAHCQPGFLSSLLVILGEHDLSGDFERLKPISIPVRRMIVHRHYNPATFENDLALLELERPVVFQPHIVPICLPARNEDFTGRTSYVTGWGKLSHGGSVPNVLQYVQVPILSNNKCQQMFMLAGHVKAIRENFVCAGYDRGNRDSCEGDSGGPLTLLRDDGRWVLVGTVSHGIRCAEPNMPGVYMRTSAYRAWIDSVMSHKS